MIAAARVIVPPIVYSAQGVIQSNCRKYNETSGAKISVYGDHKLSQQLTTINV
jgi:hypothetical protein